MQPLRSAMIVVVTAVMIWMLSSGTDGARILAVIPYNARSHFVVMEPLLLALHSRGHHLTVLSSFPQKTPLTNYRDIDLSDGLPAAINNYSVSSIKANMPNVFKTALYMVELHMHVCDKLMADQRVQNLLKEEFDLVIGEIFAADCFNYLAHQLKTPFLSWVTSSALPWMADRTGLPDNPAYIPNYFLDYGPNMNLPQRLFNVLTLVYAKTAYYFYSELPSRSLAEKVFGKELPSMGEVNKKTSLVFVNSHFTLSQSRPFPPQVVEVGGIHIKEVRPLPQDLRALLDSNPSGTILFSLGSLVRVSSLPRAVIRMFLEVFATLPQTVIFKYEDDLPGVPPNVVVRQWLPQTDIIAHPNVKAVITHCGLASTIEAVHFAKPVVGLPFYSDQFHNTMNLVRKGAAIMLDYDHLNLQDISKAIKTVINEPSYSENMTKLSRQFRDRPLTALQTAVYWTEYVIRHRDRGASHLRPSSVDLPLYQYLLLDVIALLLLPLLPIFYLIYFLFFRAVEVSPNDYRNYIKNKKED